MAEIKEKSSVIKETAADAGGRMKEAFVRSARTARRLNGTERDTPGSYAADNASYASEDAAEDALRDLSRDADRLTGRGRDALRERQRAHSGNASKETATERPRIKTKDAAARYVRQTERGVRQSGKSAVRTSETASRTAAKSVKTAEAAAKAAVRTAEASAKTAKKTAEASARTAQKTAAAAREAAVAAYNAAVAAGKAVAAAAKAVVNWMHELAEAIASGGWVAVLMIVLVMIAALIACSCFGIFFSSEDTGGPRVCDIVRTLDKEFSDELDEIKNTGEYDLLVMSGSRAPWQDILAVYSVRATGLTGNPMSVFAVNDDNLPVLCEVFREMTFYTAATVAESNEEGTDETVTLYISVGSRSVYEMAELYGFTERQREQLSELTDEKYRTLWIPVIYGTEQEGADIVAVALSQIGNVGGEPYWSWYGFGSRVEWCACFVSWCANECGLIESGGVPMYCSCSYGADWFRREGRWLDGNAVPEPGMIVFFDWNGRGPSGAQDGSADHTGIVEKVGSGYVYTVEGNSSDGCRENCYPVGHYEILGYGYY